MAAGKKTSKANGDGFQPARRSKTESSSTNKKNKTNEDATTTRMQDQLNRARAQVYENKLSTQVLHMQWKRHLLNLSYLLIVLSFMQLKGPAVTCLQDIKAYNNHNIQQQQQQQDDSQDSGLVVVISGLDAMKILFMDSIVPTLAIITAASLSFFLIQTATSGTIINSSSSPFYHPSYMIACACIPVLLLLSHVVPLTKKDDKEGCIDDLLLQVAIIPSELEMQQRPSRGFPVVFVFHVILTVCVAFMESQMKLHDRRIVQVDNLIHELHADSSSSTGDNAKPIESKKSK
jgi:hypothetical protein